MTAAARHNKNHNSKWRLPGLRVCDEPELIPSITESYVDKWWTHQQLLSSFHYLLILYATVIKSSMQMHATIFKHLNTWNRDSIGIIHMYLTGSWKNNETLRFMVNMTLWAITAGPQWHLCDIICYLVWMLLNVRCILRYSAYLSKNDHDLSWDSSLCYCLSTCT